MKRLKIYLFAIIMLYGASTTAQTTKPSPPLPSPPDVPVTPQPPAVVDTEIAGTPNAKVPPVKQLHMKKVKLHAPLTPPPPPPPPPIPAPPPPPVNQEG